MKVDSEQGYDTTMANTNIFDRNLCDRKCYALVMNDGTVLRDHSPSHREYCMANLIVGRLVEGHLFVAKERFGVVGHGTTVDREQAEALVDGHVELVCCVEKDTDSATYLSDRDVVIRRLKDLFGTE